MKEYLVKSSSKVVGPFSEDELIDLLIHNQISLLDEIKKPNGRWIYLREDTHLREVMDLVRSQMDLTDDITEGGSTTRRISDELTPTPTARIAVDSEELRQSYIPKHVDRIKEIRNAKERTAAKLGAPGKTHMPQGSKAGESSGKLLMATFVVVIVVGYLFATHLLKKENENPQALFFKALTLKQNQMALSSYQAMDTKDRMDLKVKKAVLPLLANFDKGNAEARDSLLQLIQSVDDRKEKSIYANAVGVGYMHEQKWAEAARFFESSIKYDSYNPAPAINLATLKLLAGHAVEAMEEYKRLLSTSSFQSGGAYASTLYKSYLQFAMTYAFYHAFSNKDMEQRKKSYEEHVVDLEGINLSSNKQIYLSFEINYLMFLIHLEFVQDQIDQQFQMFFRHVLSDPNMQYKSADLYWEMAEWKSLRDFCNQTSLKSLQVSLFKSICLLKSNQETEAERTIKESILQFPKEKDTMLTYAIYLLKVGKYDEAKAQTDLILKSQPNHVLAKWVQSVICVESSRESCAAERLREILTASPWSITSWVDLFHLEGEKVKYEFPLENLSPIDRQTYLPYIEVVVKDRPQ